MKSLTNLLPRIAHDRVALADDELIRTVLCYAADHMGALDVYRHPNDFVKITVGIDANTQLRVHVWDRDGNDNEGNIHSHRHPIRSRVVSGSFEEKRFIVSESGSTFRRYEFEPGNHGDIELVENGNIRLSSSRTVTRSAGEVYEIPLDEFHDIGRVRGPVVTVFAQDLRHRADGVVASEEPVTVLARPALLDGTQLQAIHGILTAEMAVFANRPRRSKPSVARQVLA